MPAPALRRLALTLAATGGLALPLAAQEAGGIAVEQPWARAAVQGGVGGAFMRIENRGAAADRLVSASSPVARTVELHATVRDGDVMRMRPVQAIDLPAHGAVQLQPGGLHMMLIGLNRPLSQGERVPVTLTFEHAGSVAVELAVQGAGAGGMAGHSAMPR
ncbi:copper chaperone PCu(A)C [Belnapia sp. T18]|uniref:Copper chaperone PCu(A)C n=1 Tax=Belnapia arida TaxID=2804533 RepID=A0ABS1U8T8_9PROT|nr:copper chaperone PCu(A)C [Belnapia arida]MBL6080122.1 copper chaperone PCu(A)C [Belnapia arida]